MEKPVEIIYLSGEGLQEEQLINFFNSQLEREVRSWNPLQGLQVGSARIDGAKLNKLSSMLAVACGLALR